MKFSANSAVESQPNESQLNTSITRFGHRIPKWVQDASEEEILDQPWKKCFTVKADDPNFAQGKDPLLFFDKEHMVCYGEGSIAA